MSLPSIKKNSLFSWVTDRRPSPSHVGVHSGGPFYNLGVELNKCNYHFFDAVTLKITLSFSKRCHPAN
eukprot:NODE_5686_length_559_cov_22.562745_g4949_i0.p2 GENE.NODE_5686_length_559_cov_22.562745_g4949_i0~~NODE_5686_length_559_cov_22.562745_g4949_i0.p2  ORF type:complete len:68 (+),score=1.08 NODE_5686_length_559_cov_22.562745_g4949_i0:163-366(+)